MELLQPMNKTFCNHILPNFLQVLHPKGQLYLIQEQLLWHLDLDFGAALIVKTPLLNNPLVLPCELGHVQVPTVCENDPGAKEEHELIQHVSEHYYGGSQTPEYEDLSSGRGIQLWYQFFLKRDENVFKAIEQIDAGEVAQKAHEGDKTARNALFLRLGKQLATSLQCDSILIALDNQVKNAWFVDTVADQLKEEFYNFIRPDWMEGIRVYTQTETLNFNILSNDYMAHKIAAQ